LFSVSLYAEKKWGIDLELNNYYPTVYVGSSVSILAKVTHIDGENSPPKWNYQLYISSPLPPGITVTIVPNTGILNYVGDYKISQVTFYADSSVTPGVYYVNLTVYGYWTEGGGYGGGGTTWKCWVTVRFPLTVKPKPSDLVVSSLSITPPSPMEGQSVVFQAVINNTGEGDAPATRAAFFIDNKLFAIVAVPPLEPGGSITISSPSWKATLGNHTLLCIADYFDEADEGYYGEYNNQLSLKFVIARRPYFKLNITPAERTVRAGKKTSFIITGESYGGFKGWVNLTCSIRLKSKNETVKEVSLKLDRDSIWIEPSGLRTTVRPTRAILNVSTTEEAFGDYIITVEGEGTDEATGVKSRDECEAILHVVSVEVKEVKAFYKLDSFFLGGMSDLIKPNRYYVKVEGEVDHVVFIINNKESAGQKKLIGGEEWFVSPWYDMGTVTTNLIIRVVGKRGDVVEEKVNTNVYYTPLWLRTFIAYSIAAGTFESKVSGTGKFDHTWTIKGALKYPPDKLYGEVDLDWLKFLGGDYGFELPGQIGFTISSTKIADISGEGDYEVEICDVKAGVEAKISGRVFVDGGVHLSTLNLSVYGYIDIPVFKYGKVIKIWIIKIGFEVGVGIYGGVGFGLSCVPTESGGDVLPGLNWVEGYGKFTLGVKAWGTLAVVVVSATIEGWGQMTIKVYVPKPYWRRDSLILEAGVKLVVDLWFGTYTIFKRTVTYPSHTIDKFTNWTWIPRTWAVAPYAEYRWSPSLTEGFYLWNVYKYVRPKIASDGRNVMIVWMHDDLSKPFLKGYEIYYALWDGEEGVWSEPMPVTDNNIIDGDPALTFLEDGSAILVWSSIIKEVRNETDPLSVMSFSELYYSVWNPSNRKWSKPVRITENSMFECHPVLSSSGDSAILIWVSDADARLDTLDDEAIFYSIWSNGAWSEPREVVSNILLASKPKVGFLGGKAIVVWAQHTDGNLSTLNDIEVYYSILEDGKWSKPVRLTSNDYEDNNPSLSVRNDKAILAWVSRLGNDTIWISWLKDDMFDEPFNLTTRAKISDVSVALNHRLEPVVLWLDGLVERPYYMYYVKSEDRWTEPQALTSIDIYQRDYDFVVTDYGSLMAIGAAYNSTNGLTGLYAVVWDYIINKPPEARFSYTPEIIFVGDEVSFKDESVDPEGYLISWRWDFGDGASSSERNPVHVYEHEGRYEVSLEVSDELGETSVVRKTIEVYRRPRITINVSDSRADLGGVVKIFGEIDCRGQRLPLKLVVTNPQGVTEEYLVETDEEGRFSFKLKAWQLGKWQIKAVFNGKDYLLESESEKISIDVVIPLLWIVLVVLGILSMVLLIILKRRRR